MKIKFTKGHKVNLRELKDNGFKKLSKEFWSDGEDKIRVVKGRYHSVQRKPRFQQMIMGFKGKGGNSSHHKEVIKCCR